MTVGPNSTDGGSVMNATGAITSIGLKWAQLRLLFAAPTTGTCKSTNSSILATPTTDNGDKSSVPPDNMPVKSPENLDHSLELKLVSLALKSSAKISTLQKALLLRTAIHIERWTFPKINKGNLYLPSA